MGKKRKSGGSRKAPPKITFNLYIFYLFYFPLLYIPYPSFFFLDYFFYIPLFKSSINEFGGRPKDPVRGLNGLWEADKASFTFDLSASPTYDPPFFVFIFLCIFYLSILYFILFVIYANYGNCSKPFPYSGNWKSVSCSFIFAVWPFDFQNYNLTQEFSNCKLAPKLSKIKLTPNFLKVANWPLVSLADYRFISTIIMLIIRHLSVMIPLSGTYGSYFSVLIMEFGLYYHFIFWNLAFSLPPSIMQHGFVPSTYMIGTR